MPSLSLVFYFGPLGHEQMVQAKKKSKPKLKPTRQRETVKKHGNQADIAELCTQLDALGLQIVEVMADGNCFFRALADQLEGNQEEYGKYRSMVVQYISKHREDFEPFIEDDVPFDEYCQSMEKDGTWAGNMELQAASLVTRRNICIHRLRSPRWYISNFSGHQTDMVHLCYHDGEHYNSVRLREDTCEGAAKPIVIKADANISQREGNKKLVINKSSKGSSGRSHYDVASVKLVMAGTSCHDVDKVEQVLQEVDGDVDAAIEFLITEREIEENQSSMVATSSEVPFYNDEDNYKETSLVASDNVNQEQYIDCSEIQHPQGDKIYNLDKKLPRNKECSCGSKKKHKAVCSSTVGKTASQTPVICGKVAATRSRREKKQARKREAIAETTGHGSGNIPDVGALCI